MTRRAALAGPLILTSRTARAQRKQRKPNFLYLIADDHAGYVMGCDGNRLARTPNLDRLAAEGTRFARNYCNSPVCTPSRQSFLTGQLPCAAGVTVLQTPLAPDKPTVAKQLKAAGYRTAVFGKMHFNRQPQPGLHGFDELLIEGNGRRFYGATDQPRPLPDGVQAKPQWRPFKDPANIWLNADKRPVGRTYDEMPGTAIARHGAKFIEEHKDEPFALWVSFHEPHSPFDFPVEDRGKFDPGAFDVPRVGPEDAWQIPIIFRDLTPAQKQGIAAAYYTSAAFLDRNIGVVLDKLRQLDLEEDTYVVYMADHGYSLGQHGRFEKHCFYEPALRVPLIMRWPGRIRKGVVRDFTESVDVPHTILDMLGAEALPVRHGQSLQPYLEGKRPQRPRDHFFSQLLENEEAAVQNDRYKLIHCSGRRRRLDGYEIDNPTPGRYVKLYDVRQDPGEFTDLSGQRPEVVKQLQQLLLDRYINTHPEAAGLPTGLSVPERIDWFLRPRDAKA